VPIWLLWFLAALIASLGFGYWLGGYAQRRGWSEDHLKRRAPLAPYSACAIAVLALMIVRLRTGERWTAAGSVAEALFWMMLGFLLGGGLSTVVVRRRMRVK